MRRLVLEHVLEAHARVDGTPELRGLQAGDPAAEVSSAEDRGPAQRLPVAPTALLLEGGDDGDQLSSLPLPAVVPERGLLESRVRQALVAG